MMPTPTETMIWRTLALSACAALAGCGETWAPEPLEHTGAALTASAGADDDRAERMPKPLELAPPPGVFRVVTPDDLAVEATVPTIAAGPCFGCWIFELRSTLTEPEALLDVSSARLRLRHVLGESTVEVDAPDYALSCVDKVCTLSLYVPGATITPQLWVADAVDLTVNARLPSDDRFARRTLRPDIVRVEENTRLRFDGPRWGARDLDLGDRISLDEDVLGFRESSLPDDPR